MEYLEAIGKIIKDFMNLEDGQIYFFNQMYIVPNDKRLYVCIGYQGDNTISNIKENKEDLQEFTTIKQKQVSIIIYSYGYEAIDRKEEIIQALNSNESENIQSLLGFHIGNLPISEENTSEEDGTKVLNKYNLLFNIIVGKRNNKTTTYYDNSQFLLTKNN